jgi:hypothetical protein
LSANEIQIAGDHYKRHKFETWDVILDWELGYLDGNAVKYISRWKDKGGRTDILKAIHYLQKLVEVIDNPGHPHYTTSVVKTKDGNEADTQLGGAAV